MKCFLAFLSILSCCFAVSLDCSYYSRKWIVGTVYVCGAQVLDFEGGKAVTEVTQNHLLSKTNQDVTAITFYYQSLDFVPQNIDSFFENIRILDITKTNLKVFTNFDLNQFPKLQVLGFGQNPLQTVDGDLFLHNPLLQHINMRNNSLTNMGPNIFTHLQLLRELYFEGNLCISEKAETFEEIRQFSQKLAFRCPPSVEQTEKIILRSEKLQTIVDTQVADRINPVVFQINQYENNQNVINEEFKERIVELEKIIRELSVKC